MSRQGRPAKISTPILYAPVERERLFSCLDKLSLQRAIWIGAPPGAGKTTLVTSWLHSRKKSASWYQVDSADNDAATFFFYLGQATHGPKCRARALPLLTSEFSGDIPAFARRFFRALFPHLGEGAVVVLDNLQEASNDSALYRALAAAVEEIPHGAQLILISREAPDAAFARLSANRALGTLDGDALKFTLAETQAMVFAQAGLSGQDAQALHDICNGWAAGLSLLTERSRGGAAVAKLSDTDSLQQVFDYFVGEIWNRLPPRDQRTLMRLSCLPLFTSDLAIQASGDENAGNLVGDLYRRNLFVDRRQGDEPWYQFHSLFRAFLVSKAAAAFPRDELTATKQGVAALLQESGATEEAFNVWIEAGDWLAAALVIRERAKDLLRQGRHQLVRDWIEQLPSSLVEADPWLSHWAGMADIGAHPCRAKSTLERAFSLAANAADQHCQMQTVAGIIEAIFLEFERFAQLDRWISVLQELLAGAAVFADANGELRVYAALVGAVLQRQGNPPALASYVARTLNLLQQASDANLQVAAATHLLRYGTVVGSLGVARRTLALIEPILADPDVTPLRRGLCEAFIAWFYVNVPQESRAREAIERLDRLGLEQELPQLRRVAAIDGYWLEMSHLRTTPAARWLKVLEEVMDPDNAYDVGCFLGLKAWSCLLDGDVTSGLSAAQDAVTAFDEAGSSWHRIFSRAVLSWAYSAANDFDNAEQLSEEALELGRQMNIDLYHIFANQLHALRSIDEGDETAVNAMLEQLFSSASAYGTGLPLRFIPTHIPRLCAAALVANIHASYVRALVNTWGWPCDDYAVEAWPWPVRLYSLGRFELYVNGECVDFSAHAPRKVLALLKALVCLGGSNVRDHRIIDAVWPADEADAGRAAYNVAVHRLRKLLGHADAIAVQDGLVSLNSKVCWVDAFAFERLLESSPKARDIERALSLYRGPLLPQDEDEAWTASLRERLRRKFLHHLGVGARQMEACTRWEMAIEHYQRGLNADQLAEGFYQGLMRCYRALDRPAEAISVYQRMHRLFSIVLGMQPTQESEARYRDLFSIETSPSTPAMDYGSFISSAIREDGKHGQSEQGNSNREDRIRQITDHIPALISYIDREGRFRFANQAYQDWLGIEPAQLLGRHLRDLYGSEVYSKIRPHLDAAFAGETVTYERELIGNDGCRQVQVKLVPDRVERGSVQGLFVLVSDITEGRLAEPQHKRVAIRKSNAAR
jgi:PAS domain S-box-containing protein